MQFIKDYQGLLTPTTVAMGTVAGLSVAAASYYMSSGPEPLEPIDFNNQSIKLPDGSRTSTWVPDGKQFIEYIYDDARTTHETFKHGLKISRNKPCLGTRSGPNREYRWLTYYEVYEQIKAFGAGLLQEGLEAKNDTFVGIYSVNRTEWVVAEQACSMFSMVAVALYDTLGPDTCAYIINQTEMSLVICDRAEKAQILLDKAAEMNTLKCIIMMDKITQNNIQTAKQHNIRLVQFSDVMPSIVLNGHIQAERQLDIYRHNFNRVNGKKNPASPVPPKPDDLAIICYTSGTTGDPKGALLTHRNLIANLCSIYFYADTCKQTITSKDVHISYLPLAHVFERGVQVIMFMCGARIGFSSGDVKLLTDDLQALKPTIFPTVPRLLNRMYDKVLTGIKGSSIKKTLFDMAIQSKVKALKQRKISKTTIWDTLVFSKIQKLIGGNVRLVFTASAPLEPKVLDFTRCAFGCVVVEGYGQTESTAGIAFNIPGECQPGHCGPPLPCNVVKLVDVPEMDYYAKDDKGEIVCKGPNVFQGYYKNEEKTREALDDEGWLHTGDIGQWLPNGVVKIIDRKKNIFKLAQGEYVAAEKIENTFMRSEFVAQCFVEGDSFKPYLMGVIVPDEEVLIAWAKDNGEIGSFKEMCLKETIKDMILKDINDIGRKAGLKGFELVKDITLFGELFSVENGLLTPTFKNKRPQLRKYFKEKIQTLYDKHAS